MPMTFTKKTTIIWNELSYTLTANGNWDAFTAERNAYLAEQIALGKTDTIAGINPQDPNTMPPLTEKVVFRVSRLWVDQQSAEDCLQFFQNLAAKYGAAQCYVSGIIEDI